MGPKYPLKAAEFFTPGGEEQGFTPFAAALRDRGVPMVSEDTYDARDEQHVRALQRDVEIREDGRVGPQSWAAATT